jgi:hypothetical protein
MVVLPVPAHLGALMNVTWALGAAFIMGLAIGERLSGLLQQIVSN